LSNLEYPVPIQYHVSTQPHICSLLLEREEWRGGDGDS
jgi:hypothetical protein